MTEVGPPSPSPEEAIRLLRGMLERQSFSGEEAQLGEYLVAEMAALGFHAYSDEVGNAVGEMGEGPNKIVLLGHMDTVPGFIPVRQEGDKLYGRGAVDAKGPLAAFVVAAARAQDTAGGKIVVIGAVEEEAATSRGAHHVAQGPRPDHVIIGEPSGWQRITLGYKGRLLIDYELERPSAHAAGAQVSAAETAVSFWETVRNLSREHNRDVKGLFGRLDASLRSITTSEDGLRQRAALCIGLRLPLGIDVNALRERLAGATEGQGDISFRGEEAPYRADKNTSLTRAFLSAIRAENGKPAFAVKTGTSDMNVVGSMWGCPIVAYGPGDSSLDHTPDEHVGIPEYLKSIEVLTRVLQRLGGAEEGRR